MKSSVLIMAYRRGDLLREILSDLPTDRSIYIHIDGPRADTVLDVKECREVAQEYANQSFYGRVHILAQSVNLGNRASFHASLEWVFLNEVKIIVLEDDIRFNNLFFDYMDWALEKYKDNPRIFHVNGFSVLDFIPGRSRMFESYSCKPWGFGTWKTRWLLHEKNTPKVDLDALRSLPIFSNINLTNSFEEKWIDRFSRLHEGTDTYDVGWNYSAWKNNALALAPRFSFTTNVGFDSRSLHTTNRPWFFFLINYRTRKQSSFKSDILVPFPSFYDAYSDFLEWRIPSIKTGSAKIFIFLYSLIVHVKQFMFR